jgi:hypothetical protein
MEYKEKRKVAVGEDNEVESGEDRRSSGVE